MPQKPDQITPECRAKEIILRTGFFRRQNSTFFFQHGTIEREHDYSFPQKIGVNIAVIFCFTGDSPVLPQEISRKLDLGNGDYPSVDPVNICRVVLPPSILTNDREGPQSSRRRRVPIGS
jgi:hypothetical protein